MRIYSDSDTESNWRFERLKDAATWIGVIIWMGMLAQKISQAYLDALERWGEHVSPDDGWQ